MLAGWEGGRGEEGRVWKREKGRVVGRKLASCRRSTGAHVSRQLPSGHGGQTRRSGQAFDRRRTAPGPRRKPVIRGRAGLAGSHHAGWQSARARPSSAVARSGKEREHQSQPCQCLCQVSSPSLSLSDGTSLQRRRACLTGKARLSGRGWTRPARAARGTGSRGRRNEFLFLYFLVDDCSAECLAPTLGLILRRLLAPQIAEEDTSRSEICLYAAYCCRM